MQLKGPYTVKEKVNKYDYRVDVNGTERIYHADLLRKYIDRDNSMAGAAIELEIANLGQQVCVSVIEEKEYSDGDPSEFKDEDEISVDSYMKGKADLGIEVPRIEPKESVEDVKINPALGPKQRE